MSAIARLCVTCCVALPIQRWLGGIALASVAVALLGFAIGVRGLAGFAAVAVPCYVLATAMFAGYFFRVMAGPRTHRFLPHFRGKSLAALLLVAAIAIGPWLVTLMVVAPDARGPVLIPVLVFSACLLLPFVPSVSSAGLLLLLLTPALGLIGRSLDQAMAAPGASFAIAIVAVWAAAWAAFAVWYLRSAPLGPFRLPMLLAGGGLARSFAVDASGGRERDSAITVHLTATYPQRARHRLVWLAVLALLLFYVVWLLRRSVVQFPGAFVMLTFLVIAPLMTCAPLANLAARRAKLLWLKSGKSRSQLFAITERELWRIGLPNAFGLMLVFCTVIALSFPVPLRTLAQAVALAWTGTAFAVYIGLVCPPRLIEVLASTLLGVSVLTAAWAAAIVPERTGLLVSIGAAQLAGALIARAVAARRWRRIDWLVFRPIRMPFQSLRGGR